MKPGHWNIMVQTETLAVKPGQLEAMLEKHGEELEQNER